MVALPLALAAGLLMDGSVRGEARAETPIPGQAVGTGTFGADVQGRYSGPDGSFGLGFTPTLQLARQDQLYMVGTANAGLRLAPDTTMTLRQRLGYGVMDVSPLAGSTSKPPDNTEPVQPPPSARFLTIEESSTGMDLDFRLSHRWRAQGGASWTVFGGADAGSREALPLARGPQARASVDWLATPIDALRAEISGADYSYSNGRHATIGMLTGSWRTALSRDMEMMIAAGPGVGRSRPPGLAAAQTTLYAVAAADWKATAGRGLQVGFGVSLEPVGDALTGDVIQRASIRGSLRWQPGRIATLTANVSGAVAVTSGSGQTYSGRAGDRFGQAELAAAFPVTYTSALRFGVRAAQQSRPLAGLPDTQWAAFAGYDLQFPLYR